MTQIHGEYLRSDGLVLTNQLTQKGMQQLLQTTFGHIVAPTWSMGMCMQIPQDVIALTSMNEPTIGVNGYQRVALAFGVINWPTIGFVSGETYVESVNCAFPLTGVLDKPVTRLFLTDGVEVMSISSPLASTPQLYNSLQNFQYRLYFR